MRKIEKHEGEKNLMVDYKLQSVSKYLRLTLVFTKNIAPRDAIFRDFFASTSKIFISARGLGTRLSFFEV